MKCKNCDGNGRFEVEDNGVVMQGVYWKCPNCGGKGVIEPLTNEEWFCFLTTEEKVTALLDLRERIRIKMRGEIGSENKFYKGEYYREWLKEKHNKSV